MGLGEDTSEADKTAPEAPSARLAEGAERAPVPAWVDLSPYDIPAHPNPHFIANGCCILLDDTQVDLTGPERAWFSRRAELVTAHAGAERAAHFEANFDPAYERLEIHGVKVIRGERVIDYTNAPGFDVLRRERNLERLHYDGRLSVHFTLPDVRIGDVVEFTTTIYGMRKALANRHAAWIGFEWEVGVIDIRHRVRAAEDRALCERRVNDPPEADVRIENGVIDKRWRVIERPSLKLESGAPPWVLQRSEIQFSEWRHWREVAEAFTPLYKDDAALPAELEEEISAIAAAHAEPAARAAAVLRFVQGAVRYLAISIGEGGFAPRSLTEIFATRYGDCKDKAKLFVAMARRLGLDACPALVNTGEGMALNDWLPTGIAFNHCIVRLRIGERAFWLDPTRSLQPSRLDRIAQCHYGWALPLHDDSANLERMPDPPFEHAMESHERIELSDSADAPVIYEWRHVFRGVRAEMVRERLARDGAIGMFKSYGEDIARVWPEARPVRQEVLADDEVENELVLLEIYEAPEAWKNVRDDIYEFSTLDITLRQNLPPIAGGLRKHPIYLGADGRVTRRVELHRGTPLAASPWTKRETCAAIDYAAELRKLDDQSLVLEQTLEIRGLVVPAESARAYRKIQNELSGSDLVITDQMAGGKFLGAVEGPPRSLFWDSLTYALVLAWAAWMVFLGYRWATADGAFF